ncbi:hypothetical protein BC835DRAFT_1521481 [Cytidiella melzeri]|nr:hypothetical protein BC835DRAFT_1521481 [Cytidiella melzeri]
MSSPSTLSDEHVSPAAPSPTPSAAEPDSRPVTPPNTNAEGATAVKHTPVAAKVSSQNLRYKDGGYKKKVVTEMGTFYHQMPYDEFMELFAKVGEPSVAPLSPKQLGSMPMKVKPDHWNGLESSMYHPITLKCESLNRVVSEAARVAPERTPYIFKDVSGWPEKTEDDIKIDIAMYPDTPKVREAFRRDMRKKVLDEKPHAARVAWAWITVGLEVKGKHENSAFRSKENESLLNNTDDGREAQAQIAKYATQLLVRQHRVFAFIIYISDDQARLTRWDRTGCIVSTPIDLKKNPEQLLNFVYRLAFMSRAELGEDPTVELATDEEVKDLENKYKPKNPYAIARAKEILDNKVLYPIYKVACTSLDGKKQLVHFIGKHIVASYSPTGRATKGYVTFNQDNNRLSFMKDYWRPNTIRTRAEIDVYQKLKEKKVSHVATALGGGDVGDQCTVTQEYLKDTRGIVKRSHCRLFLEELARPLDTYRNSSELILLVWDALLAHEKAWTEAEILHRDISTNNIMCLVNQDDENDAEPKGILNDWDLCKYKSDLKEQATQYSRSGTWAFMSATSLQYPFKPSELADDLEGFIHVITYCGLQFHRHSMTVKDHGVDTSFSNEQLVAINGQNSGLCLYVAVHYDASQHCGGGIYAGGTQKMLYAEMGSPKFTFDNQRVSPILIKLVDELYQLLKTHYSSLNFKELEQFGANYQPSPAAEFRPIEVASPPITRELIPPASFAENTRTTPISSPVTSLPTLNTHAKIREVFRLAVNDVIQLAQRRKAFLCDKTQDQFLGLNSLVEVGPKGLSGSGKRKSDSMHDGNTKKARASSHLANSLGQVKEVEEQQ